MVGVVVADVRAEDRLAIHRALVLVHIQERPSIHQHRRGRVPRHVDHDAPMTIFDHRATHATRWE
jgi:hypothetical protein